MWHFAHCAAPVTLAFHTVLPRAASPLRLASSVIGGGLLGASFPGAGNARSARFRKSWNAELRSNRPASATSAFGKSPFWCASSSQIVPARLPASAERHADFSSVDARSEEMPRVSASSARVEYFGG